MSSPRTRRGFLADLGKGVVAFGIFGVACTAEAGGSSSTAATTSNATAGSWRRVDLGSVSSYVVARSGEGVLVDTGVAGSADAIESALTDLGLGWDSIAHVVLTHSHPDHVGSITEVMERAVDATGYVGAGDIDAVEAPRPLTAVGNGDAVMGLDVIETPGHTPGHISVHDTALGLLIAGDALTGSDGRVSGPNPRFTDDMAAATASVATVAALSFDVVVFGHGEPVEGDADEQVVALVDTM